MQQDSLEKFIQDHREAFDDAYPSLRSWAVIEQSLTEEKVKQLTSRRLLKIAAAVLMIFTAGGLIGSYLTQTQHEKANVLADFLPDISPELVELEKHYLDQIAQKSAQLASFPQDKEVIDDLQIIDQAMDELRIELEVAPRGAEEQIVTTLIRSYQIKVQILERVLARIGTDNPVSQPAVKHKTNNEVSI
ncbi:MAG: hypothetical protein R2828_14075 [Saprospiraceae bacterium]